MESKNSKPEHRKVARKRGKPSNEVKGNMNQRIYRLIQIASQPVEKMIVESHHHLSVLEDEVFRCEKYDPEKLVELLQLYGKRLGVQPSFQAINGEIAKHLGLKWLNDRIFSSNVAWCCLPLSYLIEIRTTLANRKYTSLQFVSSEMEQKEIELLEIVTYWMSRPYNDIATEMGPARLSKIKFAGMLVTGIIANTKAGISVEKTKPIGEVETDSGIEWEEDSNPEVLERRAPIAREMTSKQYLFNFMGSLANDSFREEADYAKLSGSFLMWLSLYMGITRGYWMMVLMAPITSFCSEIFVALDEDKGLEGVLQIVGVKKFFNNQKQALLWLYYSTIMQVIIFSVTITIMFLNERGILLLSDGFKSLWIQFMYYGEKLRSNRMELCENGKHFPKQEPVTLPTSVTVFQGVFFLNGVKYKVKEGPVKRLEVINVKHKKYGENVRGKQISIELEDTEGNVFVDSTEYVDFNALILQFLRNVWKEFVRGNLTTDCYQVMLNRWKTT